MLTVERLRNLIHYDPETGIFTWIVDKGGIKAGRVAGSETDDGYIDIRIDRKLYRAQRVAWLYMTGNWPRHEIDHKNRNHGDNRFTNLRDITHLQNMYNVLASKPSTSGFVGVSFKKDKNKFRAYYGHEGRNIHLGYFDTAEEASAAYQAAIAYRGEFRPIAA